MNNLDTITIETALLLFPGIIFSTILQIFNIRNKNYSKFKFYLYSFIFGIIIQIFTYSFIFKKDIMSYNDINKLEVKEFFILLIITIIIALLFVFIKNNGIIYKIAFYFGITFETGFETLLDSIYHSSIKKINAPRNCFVRIKMLDGSATYYGTLEGYDIHETYIEILLNVSRIFLKNNPPDISNNLELKKTKKYYKDCKYIYLQLKPCEFQIEYIIKNEQKMTKYISLENSTYHNSNYNKLTSLIFILLCFIILLLIVFVF